jgi:hypothetical protein
MYLHCAGIVAAFFCMLLATLLAGMPVKAQEPDPFELQPWMEAYEIVTLSYEGIHTIGNKGRFGYALRNGNVITPLKYSKAFPFSEGRGLVKNTSGLFGYVDATGLEIIPARYDDARPFSEGLAAVEIEGRFGFIDRNGKVVIPAIYDNADPFYLGAARVSLNGRVFRVDPTGREFDEPYLAPVKGSLAD